MNNFSSFINCANYWVIEDEGDLWSKWRKIANLKPHLIFNLISQRVRNILAGRRLPFLANLISASGVPNEFIWEKIQFICN